MSLLEPALPASGRRVRRVLLVVGQLGRGGTERQVVLLATALRQQGVEVQVASLYGGGPREQELAAAGIPVWIGGVDTKTHPWRALVGVLRFYRLLRQFRPDVMHAFLVHACVIAGPLARLARVPAVVAGRRSLADILAGRRLLSLADRLTTPTYHCLVANADAVAADTLRRERVSADRVHVVRNALPTTAFERERDQNRAWSDPPVALCVANLIGYKGHADLIDALALLSRPVRVLLVGEGPERPALIARIAARGVAAQLLGARSDVGELLAQADVFVLPSHQEGMSNALMEAAAAGLPCIATDVGGNREVLGEHGVLCRPHDPTDLARALESVLHDESAARELGRLARVRARERFGLAPFVQAHLELYDRLLH
ncbi:MAG TPA: glycosyltransferase [Mycobacteriales bacterium]|nr:glycosyltransferase [Mycobacteriales bacterium]